MDATVEIVVTGHNVAEPDRYRSYIAGKLTEIAHLDRNVIRYDVELSHEPNPRQSKSAQRVVITGHGKGPTVRAGASGAELSTALDDAVGKLAGRLRRSHDRRVAGRRVPSRRTTAAPGRV